MFKKIKKRKLSKISKASDFLWSEYKDSDIESLKSVKLYYENKVLMRSDIGYTFDYITIALATLSSVIALGIALKKFEVENTIFTGLVVFALLAFLFLAVLVFSSKGNIEKYNIAINTINQIIDYKEKQKVIVDTNQFDEVVSVIKNTDSQISHFIKLTNNLYLSNKFHEELTKRKNKRWKPLD